MEELSNESEVVQAGDLLSEHGGYRFQHSLSLISSVYKHSEASAALMGVTFEQRSVKRLSSGGTKRKRAINGDPMRFPPVRAAHNFYY